MVKSSTKLTPAAARKAAVIAAQEAEAARELTAAPHLKQMPPQWRNFYEKIRQQISEEQ